MSSNAATSMRKKNAATVLQDFIAAEDVPQTHTIFMGASRMPMIWAASSRRSVLSVRL
jgi:hypothetical protein